MSGAGILKRGANVTIPGGFQHLLVGPDSGDPASVRPGGGALGFRALREQPFPGLALVSEDLVTEQLWEVGEIKLGDLLGDMVIATKAKATSPSLPRSGAKWSEVVTRSSKSMSLGKTLSMR